MKDTEHVPPDRIREAALCHAQLTDAEIEHVKDCRECVALYITFAGVDEVGG